MKYVNSLKYMNSFEPSSKPSDISLKRTALLCELLGRVNINTKCIFIPGGSAGYATAVMLESVIKCEGYHVGRITSEFGFDSRKMVFIDGAPASIDDYNRAVAELKAKISAIADQQFLREEVYFALSLLLCKMNDCKYIILEGMSCKDYDLASLCAPFDIVIAPVAQEIDEPSVDAVCKAISEGARAIVSGNQKIPIYGKISSVAKTGINVTAKKNFTVKSCSGIRLDFSYGNREGYSMRSPSVIQRDCAMLVIDTAQAMRRDGVKVQWSSIESGISSATCTGLFDTFSVSPLMLFDSASDAHGVSALLSTLDEVFGKDRFKDISVCVPVSAIPCLSLFEDIDTVTVVGADSLDVGEIGAQNLIFCKDLKEASKQLAAQMKNGKNVLAFGSVAFVTELKDELSRP